MTDIKSKIRHIQNAIPVVFAADNNYAPYMSVALQSILENASPNRKYIFFVLYMKIEDEWIQMLTKQIAPYQQFFIEFINVSDIMSKYDLYVSRHITPETYIRFFIPELLQEYDKVIYLDCDMVVCVDIAELFDIDMENYALAAMRDICVANYACAPEKAGKVRKSRNALPFLKNPFDYFCAGLCVFNIALIRKMMSYEKLFEIAMSNEWDFHDQDVLNLAFEGKTLLLSYYWGFYHAPKHIEYLPNALKKEYFDAMKSPNIVHFTNKPWKNGHYIFHHWLFWKYATRTPFIDLIVERMDVLLISANQSLKEKIIEAVLRRKLGIRFILFTCVKALLRRDKKGASVKKLEIL